MTKLLQQQPQGESRMDQPTLPELKEPTDLIGQTILGSYKVEEQVAKGGMAWIYRVRHTLLDQHLALKLLFTHLAEDEIVRSRFVSEAKIQFRLKHPNIVQVTEILNENKMLGMFQEWIDGPDLKQYLFKGKELLSLAEMWCLFGPLLDGLAYAHDAGVVHRDLKPGNILLARRGDDMQPKISDFGIAKFLNDVEDKTSTGSILGTFKYTSPEQIQDSKNIDHRADIYSVGIIMYQVATGAVPFRGAVQHVLYKHMHELPTNPCKLNNHLPPEFGDVVMRCLAKDPNERYPDCRTLKDALGEIMPKWGRLVPEEERLRLREERKKARERGETGISLNSTHTNSMAYSREDLLGHDAPSMSTGGGGGARLRSVFDEDPHPNSSQIDGRLKAAQLAMGGRDPDNSISLNLTVSRNFVRNSVVGILLFVGLIAGGFAYLLTRPPTSQPKPQPNQNLAIKTRQPSEPQQKVGNPALPATGPSCTEGETRPCYTGPAGTKDKGPCKAGTQTCKAGQFGACEGQVIPQPELCNEKDDNCDGQVDESFDRKGQRCSTKKYACRYAGTWKCNKEGALVCAGKRLVASKGMRAIQLRTNTPVSMRYRGRSHSIKGRYCVEVRRNGSVTFKASGFQICTFSARKLKSSTRIEMKKKSFLEESPDYCIR